MTTYLRDYCNYTVISELTCMTSASIIKWHIWGSATVSGLNDPGNGVQRGSRNAFSCSCQKYQLNQQQRVYKPRGVKETAPQCVQVM